MEFKVGDVVYVHNDVKLKVNGEPLSQIPGIVTKVTSEHLFLRYETFKYVADKKECKRVKAVAKECK